MDDILLFKSHMWLIELLTSDAMKNYKKSRPHWDEIFERSEAVLGDKKGKEIDVNEDMSLRKIIEDLHLNEHREIVEEITKKAEK